MPAPLTPGRRAALSIGVPLLLVSIAWNGATVAALAGRTTTSTTRDYAGTGQAFAVDAGHADVTVGPSPDGGVHLTTTMRFSFQPPTVSQTRDINGVHLSSDCPWYEETCSISYALTVPPSYAVDVRTSDGNVSATGLTGPVTLTTGAGDVTVSHVTGEVTLAASAGDIAGRELEGGGRVTARTAAGDVNLEFRAPPLSVTATSAAGNVTVRVPPADYRMQATTTAGNVRVTVPNSPGADRTITAVSTAGDVTVVPVDGQ